MSSKSSLPPVGAVNFGDLRRVTPVSSNWGFDRGRPIDRVYIEHFLAGHAADIKGSVLSMGDDGYARQYGDAQVVQSEVLDIRADNPRATIVADIANPAAVPAERFDCFICPQTLQFVFDVAAAVRTIGRVLKPGGVALVTVPGLSHTNDADWGHAWSWNFAPHSVRQLFDENFPGTDIEINACGNALTAVSFLMGLAEQDLKNDDFDQHVPGYAIVFTVRAVRR
jgi:SAM-dependent methyltransferase